MCLHLTKFNRPLTFRYLPQFCILTDEGHCFCKGLMLNKRIDIAFQGVKWTTLHLEKETSQPLRLGPNSRGQLSVVSHLKTSHHCGFLPDFLHKAVKICWTKATNNLVLHFLFLTLHFLFGLKYYLMSLKGRTFPQKSNSICHFNRTVISHDRHHYKFPFFPLMVWSGLTRVIPLSFL